MITTIAGKKKTVKISRDLPTVVIGERINPTGRKRMAEAIKIGDLQLLAQEALSQLAQGAKVIDVNVGAPGVDQVAVLPEAVKVVAGVTDVPLCIDSSDPDAIAAALAVYEGKALVNSVTGEEESLSRVLPVVKKYGAAVIGLCNDESGIPRDPNRRFEVAQKILDRAREYGIDESDVLIDPLVLTVGAESDASVATLQTTMMVAERLGLNMTLGASNVSFGLPDRHYINNAFLVAALFAGVTAPITNPGAKDLMETILAVDLLRGKDDYAANYLKHYRKRMSAANSAG